MRAGIRAKLDRLSAVAPAALEDRTTAMTERHYTFNELATMWNLSYEKIRRLFINETGTVPFGDTYRIPESVVRRVYARLSSR